MKFTLSAQLTRDIREAVAEAALGGIVNIPLVAERVRRKNVNDNVALEDVTRAVLMQAQLANMVVEFDASGLGVRPAEPELRSADPELASQAAFIPRARLRS